MLDVVMSVDELESAVRLFSPEEPAEFRLWFVELGRQAWDTQFEKTKGVRMLQALRRLLGESANPKSAVMTIHRAECAWNKVPESSATLLFSKLWNSDQVLARDPFETDEEYAARSAAKQMDQLYRSTWSLRQSIPSITAGRR